MKGMQRFRATGITSDGSGSDKATQEVQIYLDSLPVAALGWRENRVAELNGDSYSEIAAELWRKVEEWCAAVARDYCGSGSSVEIVTLGG